MDTDGKAEHSALFLAQNAKVESGMENKMQQNKDQLMQWINECLTELKADSKEI